MRRFGLLLTLFAAGCSTPATVASPPVPTVAALLPATPTVIPTVLVKAVTATPTITAPAMTPEQVAEVFMRAVYQGDAATATAYFPYYDAAFYKDHATVTLTDLRIRKMTRAEASDNNPLSVREYVEVATTFRYQDRTGAATHTIILAPNAQIPGGYVVAGTMGGLRWE